jgi:hypothetical protein
LIGIAYPQSTNPVKRLYLYGVERIHAIDRERDQSRPALEHDFSGRKSLSWPDSEIKHTDFSRIAE